MLILILNPIIAVKINQKSISEGGRIDIDNILQEKRVRTKTKFLDVTQSDSKKRRKKQTKVEHKTASVVVESSKCVGQNSNYEEKEKKKMIDK